MPVAVHSSEGLGLTGCGTTGGEVFEATSARRIAGLACAGLALRFGDDELTNGRIGSGLRVSDAEAIAQRRVRFAQLLTNLRANGRSVEDATVSGEVDDRALRIVAEVVRVGRKRDSPGLGKVMEDSGTRY